MRAKAHDRVCGCGHLGQSQSQSAGEGGEAGGGGRPFAFASSPRHFERDRPFAVDHLALDLTLDFDARSVRGSATLSLRRIDPDARTIELDAVAFAIDRVTLDGQVAPHVYDGKRLSVTIPSDTVRADLAVHYSAVPRRGMYFLDADEHVPNRPKQAWTQCQEEDARHFIPCHDKPHVKMTTETRVRVPRGFYVLSNGELVSRDEDGDDAVFQWRMSDPHASYLITIVAGEFDEITESVEVGGRSVPLSYFVPKGAGEDGRRTFGHTPEMVATFSELFGVPYPWNKYAQVVVSDFFFGGMENTTATTLYEHVLLDARAAIDVTSDDLIAHELAHQWFGDLVTCRDWSEGWLNEGFATFSEHVWREKHLGKDEYEYGLKVDLGSYIGEAGGRYRRPIVCQDYDAPLDLFDRHLYEKGGLVLHVLRAELGEELFWKGVSTYLRRHARGIVETRDLLRALEEVSGRSLGRRFEELVYRPGHVELDVELKWEDGVLVVSAKQTQSTHDGVPSAFEVILTLAIGEEAGKAPRHERVRLATRTDTFAIACPSRPRFVVVDPEMRVLGDVHVKAPIDMLRRQLAFAPTARGRWLAAQTLGKNDDPVTIDALVARLASEEEFWGVRVECAAALGQIRARECEAALIAHTNVAHPKVRRAVVEALGKFRTTAAVEALKGHALRDESYLVEAEAARSLGKTRQPAAFEALVDVMARPSWADVIACAAVDGLAALRDERALPHLYARTRYGNTSRVRRAAALAIPKLATDRKARELLEDLLTDGDTILRLDVVRALGELGDPKSRPALRARVDVDLEPRVRRRIRETLRDLGTERPKAEALRDDFDKLQSEHAELRARVSKLEARLSSAARSAASSTPLRAARGARAEKARAEKPGVEKKTTKKAPKKVAKKRVKRR